jgi:hypothetical protein
MRFFVKKSQKDKKSGLYLSDFYLCKITKTRKLDTLLIPYCHLICMGIFKK